MKKVLPYIIIVVLVAVLASGTTYIIMDKKQDNNKTNENDNQNQAENNNENKDEEENKNNDISLNNGVKFINIKENNDKIIQKFEITLNGRKSEMNIEYEYSKSEMFQTHNLRGKYNNLVFSDFSKGEEYFPDTESYSSYYQKENFLNVNLINNNFNEANFKIIKGIDNKNYLLVISNSNEYEDNLYVFNDELELITDPSIAYANGICHLENVFSINNYYNSVDIEDAYPWYPDEFKVCTSDDISCHINVKIENNKIYYLNPIFNEDSTGGIVEERVYEINNNKLEYEVINTYSISEMFNQC